MYQYYLRPGTTTIYGGTSNNPNNVVSYTNPYGLRQKRLTTPKVKEFVQTQFACGNATVAMGGDLEDQGGAESLGAPTHRCRYAKLGLAHPK